MAIFFVEENRSVALKYRLKFWLFAQKMSSSDTTSLQIHARATINLASALVPGMLLIVSDDSCKIILIILFCLFLLMLGAKLETLMIEVVGCLFILLDIIYLTTQDRFIEECQIFGRILRLSMFCRHEVLFIMSKKIASYNGPKLTVAKRTFDKCMTPSAVCLALTLAVSANHNGINDAVAMAITLGLIFTSMIFSMIALDRELVNPVEQMLSVLAENSNVALDKLNLLNADAHNSAMSPFGFHGDVAQYAVSGLAHAFARTLGNEMECNDSDDEEEDGITTNKRAPIKGDTIPREPTFDDRLDPLLWAPVSTMGNPFLDLYQSGRIREEEERLVAQTMTAKSMKGNW
jgi:hypothetical protein